MNYKMFVKLINIKNCAYNLYYKYKIFCNIRFFLIIL